MTAKTKLSTRLTGLFLCLALVMSLLPLSFLTASAAVGITEKTADAASLDGWQEFFPISGRIHTENAGGIWTDKSVMTDATLFSDVEMADKDNFLVALSAMGSNMSVTGHSNVPTDTMLVLDVSGSMSGSASALVRAANNALKALLNANEYNRVGVVLYSGPTYGNSADASAASLLLPLGRYTSEAQSGNLIELSGTTVRLINGVYTEGTTSRPSTSSKQVTGGTYIQAGINLARKQFVSETNNTVVNDPLRGEVKRSPVLVLMSDGAPTFGSTDFTNPDDTNLGTGSGSNSALGFATQLTISYAKQQLEAKYETKALVYTLGLGLTSSTSGFQVAQGVLDPSGEYPSNTISTSMKNNWRDYGLATVGDTIKISTSGSTREVKKIQEPLVQNYVSTYYNAASTNDLIDAFDSIVADIQLQTKYFPTLTEANENLSGYITFVDKIGKYMEVKDMKGLRIHQTLFSGKDLAQNFVADGGELGTFDNPSDLGDELIRAVRARLGIDSAEVAQTLVGLAYQHGQLAYDADTGEFSNYIGWYADKDGKFLDFWDDKGGTTAAPQGAVYTVKSYGYLGEVDEAHGVAKSDMMYATVQVRETIADGEQLVTFAIPAALIPTVTYEVSLDETGEIKDLTVSGATAPIRLVYEVGLRNDITPFNLTEKVDAAYLAANTDSNGNVSFYTNQYEVSGTTGFNPVSGELANNAYAYFRPSRQNDRFYYQQPSLVYTDDAGTVYKGATKPTENMYHAYTVYYKNGLPKAETVYHKLTAANLGTAIYDEVENTWSIPAGNVRRDYADYTVEKTPNKTGTLPFVATPFADAKGQNMNEEGHYLVVGSTLGNNGRITVAPQTGIKLSKALADGAPATDETFIFTVSGTSAGNHSAQKILADGTVDPNFTTVSFNMSGVATVSLKAGETLYIGDMAAGQTVTVKETVTDTHKVQTVNGIAQSSAVLTVEAGKFAPAAFVNIDRGAGNVTVAKVVEHPFGTDYQIPAGKTFQLTVSLDLDGVPLSGRSLNNGAYTTDENGEFPLILAHDQQVTLYNLPGGTVVTVTETVESDSGFTPTYWDNGEKGNGMVTVADGKTSSVLVINQYNPKEVFPVNLQLSGSKTLVGRDEWLETDKYNFVLEEYNFANETWTQLGKAKEVNKDTAGKAFSFNEIFSATTFKFEKAGTYYYRVREEAGTVPGVTYDTALHSFYVNVTDEDMDGQLEIKEVVSSREANTQITLENGIYKVVTDFTNTYKTDATDATISVTKKVINQSGSPLASAAGFTFEVLEYNPATQKVGKLITTSQATSLTGTTRVILPFTAEGTYHYAVREVPGISGAWSYDDSLIPVTVAVTDDGLGNLVAVAYTDSAEGATNTAEVTFTNTYTPKEAQLPIDFVSKTLEGKPMVGGEFTFRISGINFTAEIDGKNNAQGKVLFDQPLTFTKVGTYFADIKETSSDGKGITSDKNAYRITIVVSDDNGQLKATYQILNIQGNTVTFVNKYNAAPVSYAIPGTKNLTGRTLLSNEFTFVLTEVADAQGTALPGAVPLYTKNAADRSFTFPSITYTKAGTYYYTVSEQAATGNTFGIQYDPTVYTVTLTVKDDGQGNLYVDEVKNNTDGPLVFNNKYIPAPTSTTLPGNKVLEGRVLNNEEFSFTLYNSNAVWDQLEERETKRNALDGSFSFTTIDYDTAGIRYYLVKENQGNLGGVTYDPTVYRVKVTVTDDTKGALNAEVELFNQDNIPQDAIEFINLYTVTGKDTVTLSGRKTLNGRPIQEGEFNFQLYNADSSFTPSDLKTSAVNQGNLYTLSLEYGAADIGSTYYYVLQEEKAGTTDKGVAYSSAKYFVTVTVSDNGDGTVKTETTVTDGTNQVAATALDFTNTYTAAPTKVTLTGTKELDGNRTLKADDFTFDLYAGTGNFQYSGSPLKSAPNKADKSFTFADIPLTEAKTYYFIVKENSESPLPGIKYDGTVYQVTVKVTDNGLGELVAADPVYETAQGKKDALVFNNSYKADSVNVTVKGTKKLAGRTLADGEFTFLLLESNEDFVPKAGATPKKALNKADESFTFDALTFDKAGTYYYVLTEDNTNPLERVTYDPAVFHLIITVTDNTVTGKLEANVEEQNEKALVFRNTYTPKPADINFEIGVDKKVNNTGTASIGPEGFSFELEKVGTNEAKLNVTTDASGKAKFVLKYTEDDIGKTYTYTVREVQGNREYVTYSTETHTYTVTISLSDDNKLVATVKEGEAPVTAAVASFTNTYHYINPPTSDNQVTLWFALLFVSTGGLVGSYFLAKRRKEQAE